MLEICTMKEMTGPCRVSPRLTLATHCTDDDVGIAWPHWTLELETKAIRRFAKVTIVSYSRPARPVKVLVAAFN